MCHTSSTAQVLQELATFAMDQLIKRGMSVKLKQFARIKSIIELARLCTNARIQTHPSPATQSYANFISQHCKSCQNGL